MLVLSRRTDEEVVFPTLGINLRVLQIRGHQVKLGIKAPQSVPVLRQELAKCWQAPDERGDLLSTINRSLSQLEEQWILGKTDQAIDALAELKEAVARLSPEDLELRSSRMLAVG